MLSGSCPPRPSRMYCLESLALAGVALPIGSTIAPTAKISTPTVNLTTERIDVFSHEMCSWCEVSGNFFQIVRPMSRGQGTIFGAIAIPLDLLPGKMSRPDPKNKSYRPDPKRDEPWVCQKAAQRGWTALVRR